MAMMFNEISIISNNTEQPHHNIKYGFKFKFDASFYFEEVKERSKTGPCNYVFRSSARSCEISEFFLFIVSLLPPGCNYLP